MTSTKTNILAAIAAVTLTILSFQHAIVAPANGAADFTAELA